MQIRWQTIAATGLLFGVLTCGIFPLFGEDRQAKASVKLNPGAVEFAKQLIEQRRFVADRKGAWREHRPSDTAQNEFIRFHGFAEYAKWHLGIDEHHPENTKARYKFPFGDFQSVHRCGLLAVESRARQFGYLEIEKTAHDLERAIQTEAATQPTR